MKQELFDFSRIAATNGDLEMFGGVCAGISYYFGFPLWLVRLVFVVVGLATGFAFLIVYLLLVFVVPKKEITVEEFEKKMKEHAASEA